MSRYKITLAVAVCCAVGLYWVGTHSPRPVQATAKVADSTSTVQPTEEPATPSEKIETTPVDVPSIEQEGEQEPSKLAFESPFPDRMNLFEAPKRQGRGHAKSVGQERSVELLGFVNVEGQRVALSIDGLVTMAAEGDKQFGIEVISIQPPSVVLQRGRQRWQASFEN